MGYPYSAYVFGTNIDVETAGTIQIYPGLIEIVGCYLRFI